MARKLGGLWWEISTLSLSLLPMVILVWKKKKKTVANN